MLITLTTSSGTQTADRRACDFDRDLDLDLGFDPSSNRKNFFIRHKASRERREGREGCQSFPGRAKLPLCHSRGPLSQAGI